MYIYLSNIIFQKIATGWRGQLGFYGPPDLGPISSGQAYLPVSTCCLHRCGPPEGEGGPGAEERRWIQGMAEEDDRGASWALLRRSGSSTGLDARGWSGWVAAPGNRPWPYPENNLRRLEISGRRFCGPRVWGAAVFPSSDPPPPPPLVGAEGTRSGEGGRLWRSYPPWPPPGSPAPGVSTRRKPPSSSSSAAAASAGPRPRSVVRPCLGLFPLSPSFHGGLIIQCAGCVSSWSGGFFHIYVVCMLSVPNALRTDFSLFWILSLTSRDLELCNPVVSLLHRICMGY